MKTVVRQRTGGSNPPSSVKFTPLSIKGSGVFLWSVSFLDLPKPFAAGGFGFRLLSVIFAGADNYTASIVSSHQNFAPNQEDKDSCQIGF